MITVTPRARRAEDRAGDPLDGLVNLFDIGIVLAVAFLLAALASLHVTNRLTSPANRTPARDVVTVGPSDEVRPVPSSGARTVGPGVPVGRVYRLPDGRLIYVVPSASVSAPVAHPSPS